jgi:UDP-N-acetylmuramoyl-tripeptide--D-alanyl-D-alanine ligase
VRPALPAAVLTDATGWPAWTVLGIAVVALVPAGLRWLRVAQREHYLAGAPARFAWRWWLSEPANVALAGAALAGTALSVRWPVAAAVTLAVVAAGPIHLGVRGRTSPLVPTRRLRSLALLWAGLQGSALAVGAALGAPATVSAGSALLAPVLVSASCAVMAPLERRLGRRYVEAAAARLASVRPTIVGVTGSYGKTSTKSHLAHLVAGARSVVASPASFNNRAGLARAVNEQLADGTEVFVAEMGAYGPGEIADLCRWCPPQISVITAVGPVHLERFRSEERILAAKSEILATAATIVLNVDDPRLADLAARRRGAPGAPTVVGCSAVDTSADVALIHDGAAASLWVGGRRVAGGIRTPEGARPTNLACAAAVALALGVGEEEVAERLGSIPAVPNRLQTARAASGVAVIDDTFNANPAGARAALDLLARSGAGGRRVVVTPGMVELGPLQFDENRSFAGAACAQASELVVVGRTNRRALLRGAAAAAPGTEREGGDGVAGRAVRVVATREEAVAWVREHLGAGDVVLYENDLPDHYP